MSWAVLSSMAQGQRPANRDYDSAPPVACPYDGELLEVHPNGTRNCPLGNYRWQGGQRTGAFPS